MKGFDDHLDNYGDPDPGDDEEHAHDTAMWAKQWNPALYQKILDDQDDGITSDDFDNWPGEWNWS